MKKEGDRVGGGGWGWGSDKRQVHSDHLCIMVQKKQKRDNCIHMIRTVRNTYQCVKNEKKKKRDNCIHMIPILWHTHQCVEKETQAHSHHGPYFNES